MNLQVEKEFENFPSLVHDSQRGWFAASLYEQMLRNPQIFLVAIDLTYKMFDHHFKDFPDRCINTGAAEASATGIAVGLALEGKIPFVYTITSFYLRAAETIGLYLDGEQVPVRLVGSGLFADYHTDGPSHNGTLAQAYIGSLNIKSYYPSQKEDVPTMVQSMIQSGRPSFIGLRR